MSPADPETIGGVKEWGTFLLRGGGEALAEQRIFLEGRGEVYWSSSKIEVGLFLQITTGMMSAAAAIFYLWTYPSDRWQFKLCLASHGDTGKAM